MFCNKFNFVFIFKPYFVINKAIKKNVRKILKTSKLLKTKEFTIKQNNIKENNKEKFSGLIFPIIT